MSPVNSLPTEVQIVSGSQINSKQRGLNLVTSVRNVNTWKAKSLFSRLSYSLDLVLGKAEFNIFIFEQFVSMTSEQELSYTHFGCFCNTNSLSHVAYLKYFAQKQEGICPFMSSEGCLEGMSGRLLPISLQMDIL